jgi:peptidyl-prolyl cis-trans isomerase SurA
LSHLPYPNLCWQRRISIRSAKEDEVDAELDQRMEYMINAVGGRDKLETYYNKTVEQFKSELRKQVRDQLVVRRMQAKITEDVKVTPSQVRRFFATIPKDSVPFLSTEMEIAQIVRLFKPGRQRKLEARSKAEEMRKRVINGEDFEIMARLYSQDPGSAPQGGKLIAAQRGQMVPEYEAAAMTLKPGQTSPVVESQFGYHVIQILDKRGNEYDSRHILIRPEPGDNDRQTAIAFLDSLRLQIIKNSITFEKAAVKHSDDMNSKNSGGFLLDPTTGSPRVATDALEPQLFFRLDTMQPGSITEPIAFQSEEGKTGVRIVYYKGKIKPHEANLKDDYQKIQSAALNQKKQEAMQKWLKKTRMDVSLYIDPEYKDCPILEQPL